MKRPAAFLPHVCPKTGKITGLRRTWWLLPLYPIIGLAALAWFILRVGAKPSRAAYPCQQASFALGTGFIAWLLGSLGILALGRRIGARLRPRGRAAVLIGAVTTAALMLWNFFGLPNPLASAWTPTDPPNSPIGTAQGIHPGRVVWVRNPLATRWDGSTGNWWSDANTDQALVDSMLSTALRSLTGASTDPAAWDALFRYFNQNHGKGNAGYAPGERIAVKINCNNTTSYSDTDNQADASPQAVLALLRQLVNQAGVPQNMITVYEAPNTAPTRIIPDRIYTKCNAEFPNVIWADCVGTNGRTPVTWTSNAITYSVSNGCGRNIPTCVTRANYLINMALMKGHNTAGVTLTAKNHYGSINAREHAYIRSSQSGMGSYSPFVDLIGSRYLGGNTLLFMIDGLYGAQDVGYNPTRWPLLFGNGWSSSLFLSQDPVAIDSVVLDFLVTEYSNVSPNSGWMPNCDNYLHEAALAGNPPSGTNYKPDGTTLSSLGVHEHWNNAVEKKYSRNLGTGAGIELVALQGSPLPAPWRDRDVGITGIPGAAGHENGTFMECASGADIWGTADGFHYVFRMLSGDGQITARVTRLDNTDPWAKAGVMIRETLDPGARHASVVATPSNGVNFQRRPDTGGTSVNTAGPASAVPAWIRLARTGDTFTAHSSSDGSSWTAIGSHTIPMTANVYIGLAVTSHNNAALTYSSMTSVSVGGGAADADGDGMTDAAEAAAGLNPDNPDENANGVPDGLDDWDGDGLDNQAELIMGTHPGSPLPPADDDDRHRRCGALGIEALLPISFLWILRRRARRRSA